MVIEVYVLIAKYNTITGEGWSQCPSSPACRNGKSVGEGVKEEEVEEEENCQTLSY